VRCLDRAKGRHASPIAADAGRALTAGTGHRVGSIPSWRSPATVPSETMFLQQFRGLEQVPRRSLWYMRRRGFLLLVRVLGNGNRVHVHKHPSRRAAARPAPSLRGGSGLSHALEISLIGSLRQFYRLANNSVMQSTCTAMLTKVVRQLKDEKKTHLGLKLWVSSLSTSDSLLCSCIHKVTGVMATICITSTSTVVSVP
jgi:hypothetical protein